MSKKEETRSKKLFDKLKSSGKDFVDGMKEELDQGLSSTREKTRDYTSSKTEEWRSTVQQRARDTSTPEDVYYSTWAWFWAMIFGVFGCLILFAMGISNPNFFLVGLLALIAIPFVIVWCLIHMIPTIKIFGFTVFDRRSLSLQRQLSLGKEIARFFSREFLEESPIFAFLLFAFLMIFLFSLLMAFL